ncbi:hypothetical protein A2115_00555 [Candidatus Woesebacteria bacterium GWA1_41_8]|uniref:Uncharacterized protein n=1 Tax=Candidatus Woesebacteria bacterium GWA1_41_8 TaxID=1802471 RepID=A0A1F7WIK0_9BACT|nr:MAG: hypothetical protein A2115_00555 [Candidatus Woesebacteria bacterium GWA1_41_8]
MDDLANSDYIKSIEKTAVLFGDEWRKKQDELDKKQTANDPKAIKAVLLKCFPDRKKHKRAWALVEVVCNRNLKAENSHVALKLWKSIKKIDYQRNSKTYLESIKNLCNKTVRPRIKPAGYTVTFHSSFTEIVKLK